MTMGIPHLRDMNAIENILFREEEVIVVRMPVLKRYICDGQNPFEYYNEWEFKGRFRFAKDSVVYRIVLLIEEGLAKVNNRGLPISPVIQLLVCLRYYATASFQVSSTIIFLSHN